MEYVEVGGVVEAAGLKDMCGIDEGEAFGETVGVVGSTCQPIGSRRAVISDVDGASEHEQSSEEEDTK